MWHVLSAPHTSRPWRCPRCRQERLRGTKAGLPSTPRSICREDGSFLPKAVPWILPPTPRSQSCRHRSRKSFLLTRAPADVHYKTPLRIGGDGNIIGGTPPLPGQSAWYRACSEFRRFFDSHPHTQQPGQVNPTLPSTFAAPSQQVTFVQEEHF